MKQQISFLFVTFYSLINLSGQDMKYHTIDSLIKNEAKEELILEQINLLLKSDTCNASLFAYKGWYYDKNEEYEAAKYFYFRSISADSLYFIALYNLGALYYNEGMREMDTAFYSLTNRRFAEKQFIASNKFYLSKIFFDKAFVINPDYMDLKEVLTELRKRIYRRTVKNIDLFYTVKNKCF
jgi:tetratricopeptide (TPR) repeat protein